MNEIEIMRLREREYQRRYRRMNRTKYNDYMREYMQGRRWLNGGPDNYLLGPHIQYNLRVWNGEMRI